MPEILTSPAICTKRPGIILFFTTTHWTHGAHQEALQNLQHAWVPYRQTPFFELQEFSQPRTVFCIIL